MSSPVLGIDLGTTNTVVAVCGREGVEVLRDRDNETLTPSIVSFMPSGEITVGRAARERRLIDAANTVFSTKRLIGRPFRTPEVRRAAERSPFALVESDNGGVDVRVRAERYSLPEIGAFVLRRARAVAEEGLNKTCSHVVITVPASFNELQRTATRDAGRIAGLHVLRILNEPTAAALAYGFGARTDRRIAIYDLGGGTFDLSILDLSGDVIEVIATAGDSYLGGDDVDALIADRMAASFLAQHRVDLSADPQAYERLRVAAEWLKVQLSGTDRAHVRVEQAAYAPYGAPIDLEFSLTRAEHDQLLSPLVKRTFDICESAMRVASIRPTQVDEVILVGGQTQAPRVRELVEQYFGRAPLTTVNPSHVVAEGAAVLGYALTGGKPAAAPAPTRARPLGEQGLHTLVPPAPSMPPPAPKPGGLESERPSIPPPSAAPIHVPASPTFSPTPSPTAGAAVKRAEVTLSSVAAPLPVAPPAQPSASAPRSLRPGAATLPSGVQAPVFPGFDVDVDDDEPTKIADRLKLRDEQAGVLEPLRERVASGSLFTAFDDEPTQHRAPSFDDEPTQHRAPSSEAPPRADRESDPLSAGRESPTPRAPASGAPLAALTLNKRPSAPPPPAFAVSSPLTRTEPMLAPPAMSSSLPPARPSPGRPSKAPPPPPPPAAASALPPPVPTSARPPASPSKRPSTRPIAAPPSVATKTLTRVPAAPQLPAIEIQATRAHVPTSVPTPLPAPAPLPSFAPPQSPLAAVSSPASASARPLPGPRFAPPAELPTAPMRAELIESVPPPKPASVPPPKPPSIPPPAIDIEEPVSRMPLLLDVTPLTLGVETAGGFCEPIIERNAPIPTEQTRRFSTSQDNQVSVKMRICQGEERRAEANQLLGTIELGDLRAAARGSVKIEVTFMIDADGTLSVRARDEATRKAQKIRIDLVGGLREEDVHRMYKRQKALNVRG
jgi:molecular chaperone DnaK